MELLSQVTVGLDQGITTLLNGLVPFVAAALVFALAYALYKLVPGAALGRALAQVLKALDNVLLGPVAVITGVYRKTAWARWLQFLGVFSALAVIAAFAFAPAALTAIILALILILSIYRCWAVDEDDRLERARKGKATSSQQELTDEMFVAVGFLLLFLPIGYIQLEAIAPMLTGEPIAEQIGPGLFVLGELVKAVPLVDWSDAFEIENFSGLSPADRAGQWAKFSIRVLFDLIVIAALLRAISIVRAVTAGEDLRQAEKALKAGDKINDEEVIEAALSQIATSANRGHRGAIKALLQITLATREDGRLQQIKWRRSAAKKLGEAGRQLAEKAGSFEELDDLLLGIESMRAALTPLSDDADNETLGHINFALASALSNLGDLTGQIARLEEAVTAYRAALEAYAREASPAGWTKTMNNLALALQVLGEMAGEPARLEEAVTAYREALEFYTREASPANWAVTMNNLANALRPLGAMAGEPARVEEAVTAYRAALEVHTREASPANWAMTMNNLANALQTLGKMAGEPARLEEAVAAYREALKVYTREASPANWAITMKNLANALRTLGEMAGEPARLEEAVTACHAALEVHTREASPAHWAMTTNNLANTLSSLGEMAGEPARLEEAVTAWRAALEVHTREASPAHWAMTMNNLATALSALGEMAGEPARLEEAVAAYRAVLEVRTRAASPANWADTMNSLATALLALGEMAGEPARLGEALAVADELLTYHRERNEIEKVAEIEKLKDGIIAQIKEP